MDLGEWMLPIILRPSISDASGVMSLFGVVEVTTVNLGSAIGIPEEDAPRCFTEDSEPATLSKSERLSNPSICWFITPNWVDRQTGIITG
jgi:hypothetical protein